MPPTTVDPLYQLVLAVVLGGFGVYFLLPRPRGRWVSGGLTLFLCGIGVLAGFLITRFAQPVLSSDAREIDWVGSGLFWLFSAGAVGFGAMLVTQRNPARGAIAFAFVILCTCGLFLLLAAPFLMAATIIIYAGAIIVTFLFVLMLSNVRGPSDENYRTREPLLGTLAGFAFLGLVLFALHRVPPESDIGTLTPPITPAERAKLTEAYTLLSAALDPEQATGAEENLFRANGLIDEVLVNPKGDERSLPRRLVSTEAEPRVRALLANAESLRNRNDDLFNAATEATDKRSPVVEQVRAELSVFLGHGHLPARIVSNLVMSLYSEHLLAVEMAGTLLLVATVGAVAIAGRRKEVPA